MSTTTMTAATATAMATALRCVRSTRHTAALLGNSQRRPMTLSHLERTRNGRERVVVLGSGWGGYTVSRDLDPRRYQVVVVSPRSYFVFTPLLAGTSVGTLEFRTILEPVRRARKSGREAEFLQGWADGVDFARRTLTVEQAVEDPAPTRALTRGSHHDGAGAEETVAQRDRRHAEEKRKGEMFEITWDKLVVAVGCYAQTFDTPGVTRNAFFLKDAGDARRIRARLLSCFEMAALPTTTAEMKKHLLSFAVVGGGPTGIEWSAELHDLVYEDLSRLYPELVPLVSITVYDVAPQVLGMFDASLAKYAMRHFARQGIRIRTSRHIEELRPGAPRWLEQPAGATDGSGLYTLRLREEGEVAVGMCVWSTGLAMNPFVERALRDRVRRNERSGAISTDSRLRVLDADGTAVRGVYALGDCAVLEGTAYPATAQVAHQKARWLAKQLNRSGGGGGGDGDDGAEFRYHDLGVMAYVGNRKAILHSGGGDVSGWIAWLIWRGAYLTKTVSWRNRILIPIYWSINWLFGRDISRF